VDSVPTTKRPIQELPEIIAFHKAKKLNNIPVLIQMVGNITPIERTTNHPWAEAPCTVGGLVSSYLGSLFYENRSYKTGPEFKTTILQYN
jgi:hypothetical protein